MKKLFAIVLFCSFILGIVSPTIEIYASEQTILNQAIDTGIATVEKLGEIATQKLETIQSKEVDVSQKERIDEKQQEIESYVDEVQKKLDSDIDSKQELNTTLVEAQKVIALKAVSGVTEYQEVSSNIPATIAKDSKSLSSAVEVMQNTFTTKNKYSLIISTTYSKEKVQTLISPFDSSVTIEFLYQTEEGKSVYELFVSEESIFGKEMLSDIKEGNIPESLLGIEVVQPEVFTLSELTGEDINATWGVKKYNPESYLSQLAGNSSVQVAVIDTGVDFTHPDLKDNVLPGYDFVNDDSDATDDQGHGTHVSGTIAAENNGQGIIGVNPNAKIIPLKICNASGFCPNYAILRALDYVKDHHISVVNMSLGGKGDPSTNPVCESIAAVTQAGTTVVSAAGNSNVNTSTFVPGGCKDVITVGAVDESLTRASFSNYGDKVDVSAPGVGIYSAAIGGGYKKLSGTSMAAPHITGLISVIKSIKGNVSIDEMKSILRQTGGKINTSLDKKVGSFVAPSDAIAYFETKKDVVENRNDIVNNIVNQNDASFEKDITKIDENLSKESEQSFSGTGDIKVFLDGGNGNFDTAHDLPAHPIEVPLESNNHIDSILPANFEGSGDVQISSEIENAKFTPFPSTEFTGAIINSIDETQLVPYESTTEDLHIGDTISSTGVTIGSYDDVTKIPFDVTVEASGTSDTSSIQSAIDYKNASVVVGNSAFISIPEMTTQLKTISVTAPGVVTLYSLPSNGGILISAGNLPGTTQIYVRDYFTQEVTHIVYVEVTPPISYETVQYDPQTSLTGYLRVGGTVVYTNGSYSYSFSNPGIVQLSSYGGVMYRTFLAPGKTDLYVYWNGQLQSMVRYTVLPLPKPIECNIVEGQKCVIPIGVLGQYTVEPYDANAQFGLYSNGDNTGGFYVQGMREGQAIIRVRSQAASWFLDTIINVKVSPAPIPQEASCTIIQNQRCDIVLYNSSRYTFSQSNPGYINTSIQESAVLIYGALPGKTDFYIKKDGVIVHTLHITVLRSDTVFINYEYTTSPTAHYMHISPLIYGHTGNKTLSMSASIGDMTLVKKGETTNLLKNGNFNGNTIFSGPGWSWIGGQPNGWGAYIYGNGKAGLSGNRLNLQVNGGGSYAEARSTDGGYFGVTPDSIPVEPNTTYVLTYNYFIDYVSGDSDHGFTVNILTQSSNGVRSGESMSMPFIKNPRAGGDSYKALKLSTDTINIKVGDTAYFNIVGGNSGYGFSKNNYNISVYSASTDGLKYRVVGNTAGTSLIQVTDSVGKKATITVNVGASSSNIVNQAPATSTAPTTGFVGNSSDGFTAVNFDYINELESGVLYFQLPTTLNPKEVGIEYKNSAGIITSQSLSVQSDGTYMEFVDKGTNIGFVPYYVTQAGAKVYYNSRNYISFAEIGVQSVEDEGVEVSSLNDSIKVKLNTLASKIINSPKDIVSKLVSILETKKLGLTTGTDRYKALEYLQQKLVFVDYQVTENVESGYVGGTYFKIINPSIVKEAGIEYYNNTQYIKSGFNWSKEIIPNESDGEYAAFILPKTKYTNVRGYVITTGGVKIYTSVDGDIITAGSSLEDYYNLEAGQAIASVDGEENIKINSVAIIPILISIGIFGISLYADYQCSHEVDWVNLSCAVSVGTTVVSVASLGKAIVKKTVLRFATKVGTETAASSVGKNITKVAIIGSDAKKIIQVNPFNLTATPGNPINATNYQILKQEIINNGNTILEPIRYYEFNGSKYILDGHHRTKIAKELGIDKIPAIKVDSLPFGAYNSELDLFY